MFDLVYATTVELKVNGSVVLRHLGRFGETYNEEKVLLHLARGANKIDIFTVNRSGKQAHVLFLPSCAPVCRMEVPLGKIPGKVHVVSVKSDGTGSKHKDCMLHNIRISR